MSRARSFLSGLLRRKDLQRELAETKESLRQKQNQVRRLRKKLSQEIVSPERLVWIFGSPRTGSTWLARMLADFDNRKMWSEPFFGVVLSMRKVIANQDYVDKRRYLLGDEAREIWLPSMRNLFLDGVTGRYPGMARNDDLLILKEPNGSMGAPLIMEAFPESRMIFLVRDPRDVVASQLDASMEDSWYGRPRYEASIFDTGSTRDSSFVEQLARQYNLNMEASKEAYEKHGGRKCLLFYETLRTNTLDELRRVHRELDLDCEERELVEVVEKHAWEAVPSERKGPGKFKRKATPGDWQTDLTPEQAATVEDICGPLIRAFYPE